MAERPSPRSCLDLKQKIAELDRVRSQVRLGIVRIQVQSGHGTEEDFADIGNSLVLLEDHLAELVRQSEEGCPSWISVVDTVHCPRRNPPYLIDTEQADLGREGSCP